MRLLNTAILCMVLALLVACGKQVDDSENIRRYQGLTEAQLQQKSLDALKHRDYSNAIKRLEAFDTLFPFSSHTRSMKRDLIYAYYMHGDYVLAAFASGQYIHLYPRDVRVDYAYYMKGMANFEQERGIFAKLFQIDDSWRDPGTQSQSYSDFEILVKQFPRSIYAGDATQHLIFLRNQFAKREMNLATFYYKRKRYVAALNRAHNVIRQYPQSPQAREALHVAAAANEKLRLYAGHRDLNRVFQHNFPTTA